MSGHSSAGASRRRLTRALVVAVTVLAIGGPVTANASTAGTTLAAAGQAQTATLDPALLAQLSTLGPTETVAVFAALRTHADLSAVRERGLRKRGKHVQALLRDHAGASQLGVRAELASLAAGGEVSEVQSWWIDNAVSFTGTAHAVRAVAARRDIASVRLDVAAIRPSTTATGAPVSPATANVAAIGAPSLWARGITGSGIVVADLDTGVDGTQPDLAGSWRGGTDSWFDPYAQHATPTDVNGHGTWTTSVMVGRDASGQAVGVAPDARWIAARVFDDSGRATLSAVHAALQWVLDPAGNPSAPNPPAVLNASWSSTTTACSTEFESDLVALRATGIVPVFAAGNSGPALNSGTSPATLPEALAVGGVDSTDTIDVSSSRGPSACAGRAHFPDVVAPGVDIPVDDLYGGTWTVSGTSLAAPHVAGTLALLLSAHPGLSADQQQAAVTGGALDLGAPGVDDVYGAGRLDAVAAEARLATPAPVGPVTSAVTVTPNPVGGSAVPVVTASLSPAVGGGVAVSARASVDGLADVALSVASVGDQSTASGALSGPLADGSHTVAVSAADAAGVWGGPASASFTVDRSAPVASALSTTPSPTAGATSITVTATATDPVTGVASAQAWLDADPGTGRTLMTVTGGSGGSAALQAVLPVSGLAVGMHTLSVRIVDGASNAALATSTVSVTALPPSPFADGFESGGIGAWTTAGGAGLAVSTAAAQSGAYGLTVTASRSGGWVRASVPGTVGPFNVRVLFDPRAMSTGSAVVAIVVENSVKGVVSAIEYRRVSAGTQVRVTGRSSSGATRAGAWIGIPATGTSVLEVDGQPTGGTAVLYVADVARTSLSGLSTNRIPASVDVGIVGAQSSAVAGAIRVDAVVANRSAHIGPSTVGL